MTQGFDPYTAGAQLGLQGLDFGLNWFAGQEKSAQQREAQRQLNKAIIDAQDIYTRGAAEQSGFYDPYVDRGLQAWGDVDQYGAALSADNFIMPEMDEFEYEGQVSDFLDPSIDYQMEQGRRAIEGSAAANNMLLSGKTLKDLQSHSQGLAKQDWNNAYQRMVGDKSFAYNDFINRFNNSLSKVQDEFAKRTADYNRNMGIADIGRQAVGTQAGIQGALTNNLGGLAIQKGNVNAAGAQIPGLWANLAGLSGDAGGLLSNGIQYGRDLYDYAKQPAPNAGAPQFGMNANYGQGGYLNQPYIGSQVNPFFGG